MLNYILNLATIALAAFTLAKDWKAHQSHWRRGTIIALIIVLGGASLVNTHLSNKRTIEQQQRAEDDRRIAATQRKLDDATIAGLKSAVDTANTAQANNTKQFLKAFDGFSQKVTDLQSQVKTEGLQKQVAQLQTDLSNTRKALTPPQAELVSSVGNVTEDMQGLDVKDKMVLLASDGTVSFTITVINISDVQARNGGVFLRICTLCSYADEPAQSVQPTGAPATDRERSFQLVPARAGMAVVLKLKPPPGFHRFVTDVTVRCENCTVQPKQTIFIDY